MGAGVKTIQAIMNLSESGRLAYGARICDIGVTQLFGAAIKEGVVSMMEYYARKAPADARATVLDASEIDEIRDGVFLGHYLERAGFEYVALDIFPAPRTIPFDLNVHSPGPALKGRFDLVMNLGTTEHVMNQLNAFSVIHDLCAVGGVMYHDLPSEGYFSHGFFRYDALLFRNLAGSNAYEVFDQSFCAGLSAAPPPDLTKAGVSAEALYDVGVEAKLVKTTDRPFQIPMEQSTSLSLEAVAADAIDGEYVVKSEGVSVLPAPARAEETAAPNVRLFDRARGAMRRLVGA
ncbi:MAG: class I SAM-dependent methyltransferase [Alphaproteobacteria bacterium]|nr:class I SAM-dependent methyltransferase [Alphaproteobacteria bacterium]